MLAALDLYYDNGMLPVTHVDENRKWRTSQVTPMGGRIIFERMACAANDSHGASSFIRININDGIVAIPGCEDGPGGSCPLTYFVKRVQVKQKTAGDFRKVCGLADDAPDRITFLHQ